ncbi:hypothetical protein Aduo_003934 [Ancylostoma duodenale]
MNRRQPFQGALKEPPKPPSIMKKVWGKVKKTFGNGRSDEHKRVAGEYKRLERELWEKYLHILKEKVDICMQPIQWIKPPREIKEPSVWRYAFDREQRKCIEYLHYPKQLSTLNTFEEDYECKDKCENIQFKVPDYVSILAQKGILSKTAQKMQKLLG